MPDSTHSSEPNRSLATVALGAGLLASASLVARSARAPGSFAEALASSAAGHFVVVAILGLLIGQLAGGRSPVGRHQGLRIIGGGFVLAGVWGLLVSRSVVDPSGLGVIGPQRSSLPLVVILLLLVVGAGIAAGSGRLAGVTARVAEVVPRRASLPILGALVLLSVIVSGINESVGLVVGAVVAIFVPWAPLPSWSERSAPTTAQLASAAVGLAVAAPGAFVLIAERYVERVSTVDGATRLIGNLTMPFVWTVLIAASMGIAGGWVIELVEAVRRRRLDLDMPSFLVSLMATTFLLRIATLFNIVTVRRDSGDPFFYHVTANLLAQGKGFDEPVRWVAFGTGIPSALHGPGFPVALSFWSRLGGTSYVDHQLASIVLGLPQVAFGVLIGRILGGWRAAVVAAVLLVVYPNIWITDGTLFVEGMMAGLTTAATWLVYRWRADPSLLRIGSNGALIAVAALTRGEALLLVVLLLPVVFFWGDLERRQRVLHAAVGVGVCIAALVPWTIYNAGRFETTVPLSTNGNEVLFYANCEDSYYGPLLGYWSFACQLRHRDEFGDPPGDQAEQAVYWREQAFEYIDEHRSRVPVVVAARIARQWDVFRPNQNTELGAFVEGRPLTPLRIGLGMFYAMMALSVVATLALRRRRMPSWPMWCHAVAVTVTAVYAYGTLRFRAPFEPILCVLAAVGAVALWDHFRERPDAVSSIEETV